MPYTRAVLLMQSQKGPQLRIYIREGRTLLLIAAFNSKTLERVFGSDHSDLTRLKESDLRETGNSAFKLNTPHYNSLI